MQTSFLSHADAAQRNRNIILHYVKKHGPISRTGIWEELDISRASVTQVIRQLEESNLILETGEGVSTGGRKPRYIMFNTAAKKLFAFDWSSHTLCLMDMGGMVLQEKALSFSAGISPVAFAATLQQEIEAITSMNLCPPEEILGLGLALPGQIDSRNTTVIYSVELGWQNVSLSDLFYDTFEPNVFLERTGNVMALGEYTFGAGEETSHFLLFILGSDGIGVSTIIHGNSQHGANYMYGELGHIKMPQSQVICSCGQRGCLEAIVNSLMLQSGGSITDQVLEYLAVGVAAAINLSDPDTAIMVGSFVDAMPASQRELLSHAVLEKVTSQHLRRIKLRFSHDTKRLALKGICAYVFDRYFAVD